MDPRKLQFLEVIVGHDGARALAKAAERAEELDQAIFPRVVTAWLESIAPFGFDGLIPGVDSRFRFQKSENGFNGIVTVDGEIHSFEDASINHLAGCVAVALGLDHERASSDVKGPQLVKLGKSIDLLVKTQLVKANVKLPGTGKKKINLPGVAAAPMAPKQPIAPTPTQPTNQKQVPAGAAGTSQAPALPQMPKQKKPTLSVTKSEAQKKCPHCARTQFNADKFSGCYCFNALSKSVKTQKTSTGYTLEFGANWDQEAILSLVETFRGK